MGVKSNLKNRFGAIETKKIESIEIDSACSVCGSDQLWLPKKSSEWQCYRCHPPGGDSLIEQTSWHHQCNAMVQVESIDYRTTETLEALRWGPLIVCPKNWICSCGCDWIDESGLATQVESVCVMCRKSIFK
jgi:hypothetical protein